MKQAVSHLMRLAPAAAASMVVAVIAVIAISRRTEAVAMGVLLGAIQCGALLGYCVLVYLLRLGGRFAMALCIACSLAPAMFFSLFVSGAREGADLARLVTLAQAVSGSAALLVLWWRGDLMGPSE